MNTKKEPAYFSYLLRLWRDSDASPWRATLQNPHTGEQRGFASLGLLVKFLEEQTGERLLSNFRANDGSNLVE